MSWYTEDGPCADVILSSRVRLARNVAAYPFTARLGAAEAIKLSGELTEAFFSANSSMREQYRELELSDLPDINRNLLVEQRLISADLAECIRRKQPGARVLISKDESVSIMIGEEDHLRIQAMTPGFDLISAYQAAEKVALLFEEKLTVAWDPQFGFLTACPTNTGTGMRASVMAHLPGLTELDQMSHVQKRLNTMGYALRGNLGEHSSPEGNLYQISNQVTLGMSESDLLQDLTHLVNQIIDLERRAREQIKQKAGLSLADRVYRSLGTLQQARLLSGKEAMRCLSDVALGEETGIFKKNPDNQVKRALSLTGAASVQQRAGCELSPAQRDEERATAMREIFSRYEPE